MKKSGILMILMMVGILTTAFSPIGDKLVSKFRNSYQILLHHPFGRY